MLVSFIVEVFCYFMVCFGYVFVVNLVLIKSVWLICKLLKVI